MVSVYIIGSGEGEGGEGGRYSRDRNWNRTLLHSDRRALIYDRGLIKCCGQTQAESHPKGIPLVRSAGFDRSVTTESVALSRAKRTTQFPRYGRGRFPLFELGYDPLRDSSLHVHFRRGIAKATIELGRGTGKRSARGRGGGEKEP